MNKTRIFALLVVLVLAVSMLASCGKVEYEEIDLNDVVERTDYTSVYDQIGAKVTIDMVEEDENGLAYATVDGVKYELGMDFLSMAMVYNTDVPAGSSYASSEDIYNEWWKLYILRWNYLVAEVPLYANEYYDLYNAKISGFVTSPYWASADAIIASTVTTADNSVILGSNTDLSGAFRASSWGKSNPGSSDLDIENLTTGHSTLQTDMSGTFVYNMNALAEEPTVVKNADGSATYTIKIKDNLVFSDGSAITAKNYIASLLANSTEVSIAANGSGNSGLYYVGFDAFKAYTGEGETVYFEGIKLLDDYTFSITVAAEYASYYYSIQYAGFSPVPLALYLGAEGDIVVNENKECGLNAAFYNKVEDKYTVADEIVANLKWNSDLPWSGPYVVSHYDESSLIATLTLNPYYTGDVRGNASIQTITYIKVESETQMDKFTKGEVDIIAGITGGTETEAALELVAANPDKYKETHYDRAGYGKIGFRGDFGPTADRSVRQAIMYTLNRPEFAQTFTGGYGSVVHGPYYTGFGAYVANKSELESKLNQYAYSVDDAIDALVEGGWIYNVEGKEFDAEKDTIRYKKLEGYELTKANLEFKSTDSAYKTVKINGEYYMPLVINWYGTQPNEVTDLLITSWQTSEAATTKLGMYITYTSCDFNSGLYGEYLQMVSYGYDGIPKLGCINFATGFTSAVYDYSFGWTIDPELYAQNYSSYFIMDEADFYANYSK